MSARRPAVSVVVPLLDPGPLLLECVASVNHDQAQVVLVDNASSDGMSAKAGALDPRIRILRNETNEGFAAACNRGAASAVARYLLFLNSDAVLPPGGLDCLIAAADADPDGAIWQPVIVSPNGDVENAGEFFTWSGFLIRSRTLPVLGAAPYAVFACTAACLLIRRHVFEEIGGFRDAYFAYVEDVDLCWRARLAGWEVRVVPSVRVTHAKGVTTRRIFAAHEIRHITFRNRLRTILANAAVPTMLRTVPMYVVACVATVLALFVSGRGRSAYAILRALGWPLLHRREMIEQRRDVRSIRKRHDGDVLRRELIAPIVSRETLRLFRDHYRWERLGGRAELPGDEATLPPPTVG